MFLHDWLQRVWYGSARGGWLLIPLSWIFRVASGLRRTLYRYGLFPSRSVGRPVVVIGNLTAGGTGKTPFILWLAERLRQEGLRAGIASRGYGGRARGPVLVEADDDPAVVGDEPVMMARRNIAPVMVGRDRRLVADRLAQSGVDVILCDDGLQHYRLRREVEILVVDGMRRFGNGRQLPAGPLREPVSRIGTVDWIICNGGQPERDEIGMTLLGRELRHLDGKRSLALEALRGRRCRVIAGIANPQRFFDELAQAGLDIVPQPLPDHGTLRPQDLVPQGDELMLMTEKDAVKYDRREAPVDAWYLPVNARLDPAADQIVSHIRELCSNGEPKRG